VWEIESAKVVFPLSGGPIRMISGWGEPDAAGGLAVCALTMWTSTRDRVSKALLSMASPEQIRFWGAPVWHQLAISLKPRFRVVG
jgi:hypothetical protein